MVDDIAELGIQVDTTDSTTGQEALAEVHKHDFTIPSFAEIRTEAAKNYQMELAQNSEKKTCKTTQNRIKAEPDKFWDIRNGSSVYTDKEFTNDVTSIKWSEFNEQIKGNVNYKWKRASEALSGHKIFGDGATPDDVVQGSLGNCWSLAAAAAVAEKKGRIEKLFVNTENVLNTQGIYAMNFHSLGVPHSVVVDDYLPLNGSKTYFADVGGDKSVWGAIYEKGLAKLHGNYEHLVAGNPMKGIQSIQGGPAKRMKHNEVTADALWDEIVKHDGTDDMMTFGTNSGSDSKKNADGLFYGHAYTILGAKKLSTGDRLLKIRNPHGRDAYTGDWSDSSAKWTEALRKEAGQESGNDGVFWMEVGRMHSTTLATWFNWDTANLKHSYFLRLNDDGSGAVDGTTPWCGPKCTKHTMTVKSDVAQTIYVSGNTWLDQGLPDSCLKT